MTEGLDGYPSPDRHLLAGTEKGRVGSLLRSECLTLRYKFEPASVKFVVIAAWPPKPRLYFYDPTGSIEERLFKTMMKALSYNPATKEDGLREFQRRGCLLVDATYRPMDGLSAHAREKEILKSYPALLVELSKVLPDKLTPHNGGGAEQIPQTTRAHAERRRVHGAQ